MASAERDSRGSASTDEKSSGTADTQLSRLEQRTQAQPRDAIAWFTLAGACGDRGRWLEAVDVFRWGLVLDPSQAPAW